MKKFVLISVLGFLCVSSLFAQTEQSRLTYERNKKTGYQDLITNPEHARFDTLSINNLEEDLTPDTILTVVDGVIHKTQLTEITQTQIVEFLGVHASPPTIYKDGDIYFNSTDSTIYIRANNLWNSLN